jgi:hypothetical protein
VVAQHRRIIVQLMETRQCLIIFKEVAVLLFMLAPTHTVGQTTLQLWVCPIRTILQLAQATFMGELVVSILLQLLTMVLGQWVHQDNTVLPVMITVLLQGTSNLTS